MGDLGHLAVRLVRGPVDSPIFERLWDGSSCYLVVPAEEKWRGHYIEMARSKDAERAPASRIRTLQVPG